MATINKSWYTRLPGVPDRTSAGGVIVRLEGPKVMVALVREGGDKEYILPKGKVEKGESLEEAAEREIGEEAGIEDLELLSFLGVESRMTYKKDKWVTTHYFLFRTEQTDTDPTDDSHDYETFWHDIENLPAMLWPEQQALIENNLAKIVKLAKS